MLIADFDSHRVRALSLADGALTTLAGSGSATFADGTGTAASFAIPIGVAISPDGAFALVADGNLRHVVVATGVVTPLAGRNGTGAAASCRRRPGCARPRARS